MSITNSDEPIAIELLFLIVIPFILGFISVRIALQLTDQYFIFTTIALFICSILLSNSMHKYYKRYH